MKQYQQAASHQQYGQPQQFPNVANNSNGTVPYSSTQSTPQVNALPRYQMNNPQPQYQLNGVKNPNYVNPSVNQLTADVKHLAVGQHHQQLAPNERLNAYSSQNTFSTSTPEHPLLSSNNQPPIGYVQQQYQKSSISLDQHLSMKQQPPNVSPIPLEKVPPLSRTPANMQTSSTTSYYPQTLPNTSANNRIVLNGDLPQQPTLPSQVQNRQPGGGAPLQQNRGLNTLHSKRYPTQPIQSSSSSSYQQQQYQPQTTQPAHPSSWSMAPRHPLVQPQQSLPPPPPHHHQQQQQQQQHLQHFQQSQSSNSVTATGFNQLWTSSAESFDLLQSPNILPPEPEAPPTIHLQSTNNSAAPHHQSEFNCSPDVFRCTLTKIPDSAALLHKSRLPLGVLIHPFKDLTQLAVIQCSTIVRCRSCRTYINPFVYFVDNKRWKCNLCYRVNELPEEFQYDPVTKTYGDPSRRPEVRASTIEYIAPAEYMLRPPQPAVYLFLLDISRAAVESSYLHTVCSVLLEQLDHLPGDARTQLGFLAFDTTLHFFSLPESSANGLPHEMIVWDVDDPFLPSPDNLLVNLQSRKEVIRDLLQQLPTRYSTSYESGSCLGAALQAAHKMMAGTGGRVTVFQATLPTIGPGALTAREDPNLRAGTSGATQQLLNPANDFYKRLALECSGQQIAVDMYLMNSQYVDIATVSGISKFSGGTVYHFPLYKPTNQLQQLQLARTLKRYLTRKIGFEAVMRVRCSRGLAIHAFHGHFFVRSTDLLSLPNVSPDAAFGMQVAIEESLADAQTVCFQAALLYTSSKAERRIRVHTLCIPVANTLSDIIHSADQQAIVSLLSKMAVDRSIASSLSDAKDACLNAAIDILSSYKLSQNLSSGGGGGSQLMAPRCLRLLPLYIAALLRHPAFRVGVSTRLDDRVKAMCDLKTLSVHMVLLSVYPDLYPVHNLSAAVAADDSPSPPPRLQLSARSIDRTGAYLMDCGTHMLLLVCPQVNPAFIQSLGSGIGGGAGGDWPPCVDLSADGDDDDGGPGHALRAFVDTLNEDRPTAAPILFIREDHTQHRQMFLDRLVEDRLDSALSYHEFLQHLRSQIK